MNGNALESTLEVGSSWLLSGLWERLSNVAALADQQHESRNDVPKLGPYLQHSEG
jgi:hypothetical protein